MNLPIAFEEKMEDLLGADFQKYIDSFEEPRLYGLRVNTSKISIENFLKICPFQLKPIPWIENGFYYDGTIDSPAKHPFYFAGLYYLQEPSAMTPANRLSIEPGERVLDLCAAPGGKATELGSNLEGDGMLLANDISNSRARGLLKNLELAGIGNLYVTSEEPGKLANVFPSYFHKILVDAPCSGEGMFRKDIKMIKSWEEQGPEYYAPIQKEILNHAVTMLMPGGDLIYSTCTFDPSENEEVISYILERYPEMEIAEIRPFEAFDKGMLELKQCVRIWPFKMSGEGHFVALLHKNVEKCAAIEGYTPEEYAHILLEKFPCHRRKKQKPLESISDEFAAFVRQLSYPMEAGTIQVLDDKVYYLPEGSEIKKQLRYLRTGLLLGTIKKKRFEPSQALAMALKKEQYTQGISFPVSDGRVVKYLKGETVELDDMVEPKAKGWHLICVEDYPLGWGKLAGGTLKNKYEPGWRWQSL